MPTLSTLFWFRRDLRLSDNPALVEAATRGSLMPIYILEEEGEGIPSMGAASRWWLHHSLEKLQQSLHGQLSIYRGDPLFIITKLLESQKFDALYWNRCYEPWQRKQEEALEAKLRELEISFQSFQGSLLWEPWTVCKSDQTPYKVFTPFYRHASSIPVRKTLLKPLEMRLLKDEDHSLSLEELNLLPKIPWYRGFEKEWEVGEMGAQKRWNSFLNDGLAGYKEGRNHPGKKNVSHLSAHLHFGEISPQQLWESVKNLGSEVPNKDKEHFLSELGWREFSYSLLFHFPELPWKNFQVKFDRFPWKENQELLSKWEQGRTGYPIVDAGMRELWQTGTMHNRVRMIVASFLVKNLLIHWHQGAAWFWDTLLDADLANNSASWQWVAGSGADAAPYFRIFNPVLQGEKFDPQGTYTLQFVPELKTLPLKFLFKPWEAPKEILREAAIELGRDYPLPIVDLAVSRDKALEAYHQL